MSYYRKISDMGLSVVHNPYLSPELPAPQVLIRDYYNSNAVKNQYFSVKRCGNEAPKKAGLTENYKKGVITTGKIVKNIN